MEKNSRIYIAGHKGMVGQALLRRLDLAGFRNILCRTSSELDLRDQEAVRDFFDKEKPEFIFLAAAKAGGILAHSTYPADFLYDNLLLQSNVIHQSFEHGAKKLLFVASACMYPRSSPQPFKEEYLLTGLPEPTVESYAIAKIAGVKMCDAYRDQYGCNFISVAPTNLYGPNDHYDLNKSHVLAALLRKFHEAKTTGSPSVKVWGSGKPRREFLHVDDLSDACLFLMDNYDERGFVNIGVGHDMSISELGILIKDITGFSGSIEWDASKPDGAPQKLLDVSKLSKLGWKARIDFEEGLRSVYREEFLLAATSH